MPILEDIQYVIDNGQAELGKDYTYSYEEFQAFKQQMLIPETLTSFHQLRYSFRHGEYTIEFTRLSEREFHMMLPDHPTDKFALSAIGREINYA